jgi:hypothetical protein
MKFIRRAVDDDRPRRRNPAANRRRQYLRLGVGSPDEPVGGFQRRARSCSAIALIGSVEAASFTPEQLRMLAEFVSRRGGGLLMLGGRRSLPKVDGGHAGRVPLVEPTR